MHTAREKRVASRLSITLYRSKIGWSAKQQRVLTGLGLRRRGQTVLRPDTPEIRGMVAQVCHLVRVTGEAA